MGDLRLEAAYLGPVASFSNQAALEYFGSAAVLHPKVSFADVFAAVQSSQVDFGVIPFENSSNGSVVQTLDLLAEREANYAATKVCGEKYLTVHHCLLAAKGAEIGQIKKLYTHPQAWGQCDIFLSKEFRGVEKQDVSSTSKAAEIAAGDETRTSAAIASKLAGEHHGCEVLRENIEDRADNTTRFFIMKRIDKNTGDSKLLQVPKSQATPAPTKWKSLVSFTIDHASPGALADALNVFKTHHLNLTSIYTRPSRIRPWHYIFFVECEETRQAEQPTNVEVALENLKKITMGCQDLGTWQDELQ